MGIGMGIIHIHIILRENRIVIGLASSSMEETVVSISESKGLKCKSLAFSQPSILDYK